MKQQISFDKIAPELEALHADLFSRPAVKLTKEETAGAVHIAVDMVNGFVKEGALSSPEVLSINPAVAGFAEVCKRAGVANYALCDCHDDNCSEFLTYPVHCVKGSEECELTDELKQAADFRVFPKLSVNGWLEPDFQKAVIDNNFNFFIITGDCTDMCVVQLALSLKSGMNRINRPCRVIIPTDLVATCNLPTRSVRTGELAALLVMQTNGIEIAGNVEFDK